MGSRSLLLLCAFVSSAVAVPVDRREQCARHCTESNQFSLAPGSTYTYDYETTTTTTVQGTTQDKSQLQLTAQVDIEVLSKCDLSLRLRGVTLKQSDPQNPDYWNPIKGGREFSRSIERQVLRFSYQDGRVEHLCPSEEAPAWVTNIHRGVLSAFQTSMSNLEGNSNHERIEKVIETDVSGRCTAEYQIMGKTWRGTLNIRKIKDLTSCTDRQFADTALQATPYTQDSPTKSLPLVTGSQECDMSIGEGFLQSSSCKEKHVFRPFSRRGGGATTTVTQRLTYNTKSKKSFTGNDYRPSREEMLFNHEYIESSAQQREQDADLAMRDLCEASREEMTIAVPSKFTAFIYKLKKLDYEALNSFYSRIDDICPNLPKAKKFFMDAIPVVGSAGSVRFMVDMITREIATPSETDFWLTSLSLISQPTTDMIATLSPLLDGRYDQAFLGVSALIHTFCTSSDCSEVPEVRDAVFRLVDNLGDNCFNPEVKKILLTLKALGNIGSIYGREMVLERCYKNPQVNIEVRLAAIQAFRRFSCDVSREELLNTYSNYNENTEIRIASYLGSMTCLSHSTMITVKETLQNERVNQVGSFVWTHLNALAKSKHPERKDLRDIISSIYLLNKYNSDIRKFSTAREATVFLDSLNSGIHADAHVIFTPESYLPRTARLNLTIDAFGHTCNLFELEGRIEGLERVVEAFFGPSGYFPQKNVAKLLRERRSIADNKIDHLDRQFDAKSRFDKQPYGSLDLKIFGNTMWYSQFGSGDDGPTSINLLDLMTDLAKEQEKEYSKSFMFMDTTYTVPLASGMPLRLAINATANVAMKIGGKFNVRTFQHVDIKGHFEPSGALEVASLLTVDAGAARTGLRMVATLHTSTLLDGKLEVKNGEIVKAELNMPRDRIEIIDIQSKLYLVHGSEETEQTGVREESTDIKSCTGEAGRKLFGVELCGEMRLPGGKRDTPMYPMSGPASISLYIRKTDPSLTSYNFDASWNKEMVNGQYIRRGIFSLNTPQSTNDREVTVEFHLSQPDHTATFKVKTPFKRFGVSGKFINEDALKKLDLSLKIDEEEKFALQSELRIDSDGGGSRYTPSLEIRGPTRRWALASGSAYLKHGQKYNANLNIEDLTETPIVLRGDVDIKSRDRYEGQVVINSYFLDTNIQGYAQLGDTISSKLTVDYQLLQGRKYKMSINGKLRDLSANALTKYTGLISMQASAIPEWDTSISWETMKTTGHLENSLSINIGDGTRSRIHTISIQEIIRYQGSLLDNSAEATFKLSYPQKNIDYSFEMKHENTDKTLKNAMTIQYAANRQITTLVDLNADMSNALTLSGDVRVKYPGRELRLVAEVNEPSAREYRTTLTAQWQREKEVKAVLNYKNRSDHSQFKHEANAEITLPRQRPMTFSLIVGSHHNQYAGVAEMDLGRGSYRFSGDYNYGSPMNHRLTAQLKLKDEVYTTEAAFHATREKITGNLDMKFPSLRRVTGKVDLRNAYAVKSGSVEVMWDVDRDRSQRLTADAELRTNAGGYDGQFSVNTPQKKVRGSFNTGSEGRFIGGVFKTNNKAELEWSPNNKVTVSLIANTVMDRSRHEVTGNVEVTTPFSGYEAVTLGVTHSDTEQQWNTELTTTWQRTNRITLTTEGKYSADRYGRSLLASVKLLSPFRGFETVSFDITHARGPSELSSRCVVQWGYGKEIAAGVYGSLVGTGFRGGANFTSPFTAARSLSATIFHTLSSGQYKTKAEVQWAQNKKIITDFEGRYVVNGRRKMFNVLLVASTPFQGYEALSSKVIYNNDGITMNTDAEINCNRNKMTLGLTGSSRNTYYNKNMDGKIYFTSPIRGYESVQVTAALQSTEDSYKTNIDAQLPYSMAASFKSQGKIASLNDIEMNAVVTGQFRDYVDFESTSIDFVHKVQKSNLRSTLDMMYGKKKMTVLLTGMYNPGYRTHNLEGSLTVNTPFISYEEMKLDLVHNKRDTQFVTRVQASKNRDSILLIHDLKVTDGLNFETNLQLTTPFEALRNLKATSTQEYTSGQLKHSSVLEWERNRKITLEGEYHDTASSKEIAFKLTTPFYQLRNLAVDAAYEERRKEYKPSLTIQWNGNRRISLEGNLVYRMQRMDGKLLFTSPFYGHEFYQLAAKYDATAPQKTTEVSFQWDRRNNKIVSLNSNYFSDDKTVTSEVILVTPFEGFEKVSSYVSYERKAHQKSLTYIYRGWDNSNVDVKASVGRNGAQFEAAVKNLLEYARDLSTSAKYSVDGPLYTGEVNYQWDSTKKVSLAGEYSLQNKKSNGKLTLKSPFEGYENLILEIKSDCENPKKTANIMYQWDVYKKVEVASEFEITDGREGRMNIIFRSPFRNYREVTVEGQYKKKYQKYEGELKIQTSPTVSYTGSIDVKHNGYYPTDVAIELDSPHSPVKDVKFKTEIKNQSGLYELSSNLEWEDKKIDASLSLKNRDYDFLESKLKITTPFPRFRMLSIEGTLRNDNFQLIDGRLNVKTPFEILRSLDVSSEFKSESKGYNVRFTMDTPTKKLSVTGELKNTRFQPLEASLNIEAPFTTFRTMAATARINSNGLEQTDAQFSVTTSQNSHALSLTSMKNNKKFQVEVRGESPLLVSRRVRLDVDVDYQDSKSFDAKITVETSRPHTLTVNYQNNRRGLEVEARMQSPLLPERTASIKGSYTNRKNKNIEGKVVFTIPSSTHQISSRYEVDSRQMTALLNMESNLLPASTLNTEAKYINGNGRDLEVTLAVTTPRSRHAVVASMKNYDGEKYIQLKLDCPYIDISPITLTGELKSDNLEAMDGTLTLSTPQKEIRIAGNMKRVRWENVEAFVTLNTPYEALRMFRVDAKFNNDRYQNIEGNLQVDTSNENLRNVGISGKLRRSGGTEDLSITLHLPKRNTVGLLANVHYKPDISSRITLSLPGKRYSVYGSYESNQDFATTAGYEWDSHKVETTASLKYLTDSIDGHVTLTTPFRGYENYETSASYSKKARRHNLVLGFKNPKNKAINARGTFNYVTPMHFDLEASVTTPYSGYEDMSIRFRQQYDTSRFTTNAEYIWSHYKKVFLNVQHEYNNTHHIGHVHVGSPYELLQELKTSYSHMNNYHSSECKLDVLYNGVKKLKAESSSTHQRDIRQHARRFLVDLPTLPLSISANRKLLPAGQELSLKTSYPTRTASFHTVYQNTPTALSHESIFTWDERARKSISYEVRITEDSRGMADTTELYGRLNFPIRSLELKGNYIKSVRGRSGGVDFYWDAARDAQKHMAIGVEHQDLSNNEKMSHRVQLTVAHPRLSKDILQTNLLTLSRDEFLVKSELEYSRHQQHRLLMEIRARNMASERREMRYNVALSLRHPISNCDLQAKADVVNTHQESSAHFSFSNMDNQRIQRVKELRAKILKVKQQIEIQMKTDTDDLTLQGSMFNRDNEFSLALEQRVNEKRGILSHFRLSKRQKSMKFDITSEENEGLHIEASFPDDSASVKVTHSADGTTTTDASAFVGLERSRILRSHITWRPELLQELKDITREKYSTISRTLRTAKDEALRTMIEEKEAKLSLFSRSVNEQLSPFFKDLSKDITSIGIDIEQGSNTLFSMYRRNEFFMKDIAEAVKTAYIFLGDFADGMLLAVEVLTNIILEYVDELYYNIYYSIEDFMIYAMETYRHFVVSVSRMASDMQRSVYRAWRSAVMTTAYVMNRAGQKMQEAADAVVQKVEEWVRHYAPCIIDMYYYTKAVSDKIRENINDVTDRMTESVTRHPYYLALSDYWSRVAATFEAFCQMDIVDSVQSQIIDNYLAFTGMAQSFVDAVSDMNIVETIRTHPHVEYMTDVTNRALEQSLQVYNALGVDAMLRSLASTGYEYVKETAFDAAKELFHEFYQMKSGTKYVFMPERGIISFEYTLPVPRNSLVEVFDISSYPEYKKLSEMKDSYIAKYYEDFCIWDTYYRIKNIFTPRYWMPPFRAHAMVAGNQHFVTFDKFAFEFAGECSYLLARDFVDANFTVAVNYARDGNRPVRKSMTVLTNGKKLEIGNDYKVTLDDTKVELPIQVDTTIAIRESSTIRIENERKGFVVSCNFVYDICTVGMSGFYFAKTGGLLGTYDYESSLDMMTPDRHLAADVETFANSWEVGKANCKKSGNLATVPGNDYRVQEKCKQLFSKSSSNFRACFKQVDPNPYMKMCINDLSAVDESMFDATLCISSAAYWTECKIEGVPLKMPKQCVRCEKHDRTEMTEGDVMKFTQDDPLHTAEIVFVVEEKKCNKDIYAKLKKLAQEIENNFMQKSYSDIRYHVVGFGGNGVHAQPHIHTMDGQEYGSIRAVDSAFTSLEVGDGPVNILEALRFAAALPFRPGSTKSFLLIKCSTCRSEELRAEYSEMLRTLLDGDITLHLLMAQKFEMKIHKQDHHSRKVIGLDSEYAYTTKNINDRKLQGDKALLAQLRVAKDVCIPLALEVNGSSFDSQILDDPKKNTRKKFMDVLSRRILKSAEKRSDWAMCCECIATEDGVGKSVCQRCVSAEVASMMSPDASPLYNSFPSSELYRNESSEESSEDAPKERKRKSKKRGPDL